VPMALAIIKTDPMVARIANVIFRTGVFISTCLLPSIAAATR